MDTGILFALALACFLLGGAGCGIVAFFWVRRLAQRLARLEDLERASAGWSSPAPSAPARAETAPPRASTRTATPTTPTTIAPFAPEAPLATAVAAPIGGPFAPEAPTPAAPPPRAAPPVQAPPRRRIDWERWIGLRGAALLGGVFLALAGILLFQYSIERGLISPAVRVGMGVVLGLAGLVGSQLLRRRGAELTANAAAGGGIVALYAAAWGASRLYGLVSDQIAFVWMAAVTALCAFLALRHSSQLVSVLGLLGGLATPLLLAQDRANPAGLFGYLLLLDVGFLMIGWRRGWSSLGIVAVLGTALLQALFVGRHMAPEHLAIVLASLGLLGVGFALSSAWAKGSRLGWLVSQAGGLATPLLFAIYFARHAELGRHLLPLAGLGALLLGASFLVARKQRAPWMPPALVAGVLGIVVTYLFSDPLEPERARQLVISSALLAAVLALGVELSRRGESADERAERIGLVAACGLGFAGLALVLGIGALAGGRVSPWPWLLGQLLLALLALRVAARGRAPAFALLAAPCALLALGPWSWQHAERGDGRMPDVRLWAWLEPAFVALLGSLALSRRDEAGRRWALVAAALAGFLLLVAPEAGPVWKQPLLPWLACATALGLFALTAAALAGSRPPAGLVQGAVLLGAGGLLGLRASVDLQRMSARDELGLALLLFPLALLALFAPLLFFRERLAHTRIVWRAQALVPWLLLPGLLECFELFRGTERGIALVPLLLAPGPLATALAFARRARRPGEPDESATRVARTGAAWCGASTAGLLAYALAREQGTLELVVALGLAVPALAWLARALAHAPLARAASACAALTALALLARLVHPQAYRASQSLLLTPISWAHLVPGAALLVALVLLRREPSPLGPRERPWHQGAVGLAAIAIGFAWITFAVHDAWIEHGSVRVRFERLPQRDLVLSLAWAVYALALLVLGMRRGLAALRWVSLLLFLTTIAKVFLLDLGNLGGLYRVGSMLGLALSLLAVSFLYQRFVFRRTEAALPG